MMIFFLMMCSVEAFAQLPGYNYVYRVRRLDEFEYIRLSNFRYDASVGVAANTFSGNVGNTLRGGAGMTTNFMVYGGKGWGGGLVSEFLGVHQRHEYTSLGGFHPSTKSHIIMVGGAVGKIFNTESAHQFALQFEGYYGMVDFNGPDPTFGSTMVIATGFIPGVRASYLVPLGPGRVAQRYFVSNSCRFLLDFHFTARQLLFNESAARGMMYGIGVSLRMSGRRVNDFKLRNAD
jgi:hypothetical protein